MTRTAAELMWIDALAMLERADQLHRGFFHPEFGGWEPPVDVVESRETLVLIAALPGVRAADVELAIGGSEIVIRGIRRLPEVPGPARIHRMELPHGRFERCLALPPGAYELVRRDLADGLLTIVLRKLR